MRKIHILGNWKMNHTQKELASFCEELQVQWKDLSDKAGYGIAPQTLHLSTLKAKAPKGLLVGSQNCSDQESGAYTGETSPVALKDLSIDFTLTGHSERRQLYKESDEFINRKTKLALENGLTTVLCVGETLSERESGSTAGVVCHQVEAGLKDISPNKKLLIAYEPVWAIGTGKTATPDMAQEVHAIIRQKLYDLGHDAASTPILYGGSVKPDNIEGLLECPDIDGALVGGASLKAADFLALCRAGGMRNA
tara:strand:- start:3353 stop:4108 length:756 start_codon:yes stop_codon:yes gene_type:complete